ncbi:MAG: right-handed parallel beta-helix repeat-containing protein [Cyanobacteriota bacterium]|nr:right-handed parallel beta-helix repeat-containing protein [Cyanobacteriota bacterium]
MAGRTISLTRDLPDLIDQVEIDGLLKSLNTPGVAIDFNGSSGFIFRGAEAEGSVLRGIAIMDAGGDGLTLDASNITVQNNHIGYALDGITGNGNTGNGIRITDKSYENLIGGIDSLTGKSTGHDYSNLIGSNGGAGVRVDSSNSSTIESNRIYANGNENPGIKLIAETPTGSSHASQIRIRNNRISTDSPFSSGIDVLVSNTSLENLAITGNTVATEGSASATSHGVVVRLRESGAVESIEIADNDISTAGPLSQGIFISCREDGKIAASSITSNTVSTSGSVPSDKNRFDLESDGIYFNAQQSEIGEVAITHNSVVTDGNDADGIYLIAGRSSVIQDALILSNTISASGNNPVNEFQVAEGIKVLSYAEARMASVSLIENTILQAEGDGILLRAQSGAAPGGGFISALLRNNSSTSGEDFGTAYNFANPSDDGSIVLTGQSIDDIMAQNIPSEPSEYSSTGTILFVPA